MLNIKNVWELEFGPMYCETFGLLFDSLVAAYPKICDIPEGTEVLGDLKARLSYAHPPELSHD